MIALDTLLQRAADAENHTGAERAAALNGASRLAADSGILVPTWPEPPQGWAWDGEPGAGSRLVRIGLPWWRGGPDEPEKPAKTVIAEPPPLAPEQSSAPVRITPAMERLVALISRPGGATIDELGLTLASARVCVSRARSAGYAIDFDRQAKRYHMAATG